MITKKIPVTDLSTLKDIKVTVSSPHFFKNPSCLFLATAMHCHHHLHHHHSNSPELLQPLFSHIPDGFPDTTGQPHC